MVLWGDDRVRRTPPRRLMRMYRAYRRQQAEQQWRLAQTLLHTAQGDWGVETKWNGTGSPPKSDWKYSDTPRREYLEGLEREAQGLPREIPLELRLRRDGAEWRAHAQRLKEGLR